MALVPALRSAPAAGRRRPRLTVRDHRRSRDAPLRHPRGLFLRRLLGRRPGTARGGGWSEPRARPLARARARQVVGDVRRRGRRLPARLDREPRADRARRRGRVRQPGAQHRHRLRPQHPRRDDREHDRDARGRSLHHRPLHRPARAQGGIRPPAARPRLRRRASARTGGALLPARAAAAGDPAAVLASAARLGGRAWARAAAGRALATAS